MNILRSGRSRTVAFGVGFAMVATFGLGGSAFADERVSDSVTAIEKAVEDAGQEPADFNAAVSLPTDHDASAALVSEYGTLGFDVPTTGDVEQRTSTGVVLKGADKDTSIAVESTTHGVRALVHIESEDAPERFKFPVGGDVATLHPNANGSVDAIDADGTTVATAMPAWAVDAAGSEVPTHFEIEGTTLIQVVEHRGGGFEYGITADPDWWKAAKCAAAITVAVGSTVFAAAKILKIKKLIRAAGGVKATAQRVMKAFNTKGSLSTKAKNAFGDLGSGMVAAAVLILDIDSIQSQCS